MVTTYSSFLETYVLTAALTTGALLATHRFRTTGSVRSRMLGIILTGVLPLASWQMLVFVPFLLFWQTARLPAWRQKIMTGVLAAGAGLAFYAAIIAGFSQKGLQDGATTFKTLNEVRSNYASFSHFNRDAFGSLSRDILFNAFTNDGFPLTTRPLTGHERGAIHALQSLTCLAVAGLSLLAAWGLARRAPLRTPAAALFGGTLLLYAGFHWYFNPYEMMLYITPAFLPLLVCLALPAASGRRATAAGWLLGCLLMSELAMGGSALLLGSKRLFTPPSGNCPVIELNIR